jgi:hypothetical protein
VLCETAKEAKKKKEIASRDEIASKQKETTAR